MSAATSSLLEYTESKIFALDISPTKHKIAFMVTLSCIGRAQSFEWD